MITRLVRAITNIALALTTIGQILAMIGANQTIGNRDVKYSIRDFEAMGDQLSRLDQIIVKQGDRA